MNFIRKIFSGKIDEFVHLQFQKFSRGEFRDRAVVNVRRTGEKYTIKTTSEFANEFVRESAEILGKNKTKITGAVISTNDLKNDLDFKEIKQFQGVKRYLIDKDMTGEEILSLLNKFPKAFFAISFSTSSFNLKIKAKSPKSGKPGKKEEMPKPDFCTLVTTDKTIAENFVFEVPNFKKAEIRHDFIIRDIIIPDKLKNEKDYSVIREKAMRKGKIVRVAIIDDKPYKKEADFQA
jgi:hypothetical protein